MTMHRLPDKKAAILSLQREDGGEMKIVQEGIKASVFGLVPALTIRFTDRTDWTLALYM
jgi:hypothetical protein